MSKFKFVSQLSETKEILKNEQKAFVVMLMKRITFFGTLGCAVRTKNIFSTNKDVQYEQCTSSVATVCGKPKENCHRFWLRLRLAVILISNVRTSTSKKINLMALIRILTISTDTTTFEGMKGKFYGFRSTSETYYQCKFCAIKDLNE